MWRQTVAGLKILIVNATLASLTGTETYVRDLALQLQHKGHSPIVYAPQLGPIARELRRETVPVVDNLHSIGAVPDIIHGNHNTELVTALLYFDAVPAVFYCHSWLDWISSPPSHPRIMAYVAVDDTCRDRLVYQHAIPESQIRVQLHAADLERFRPRGPLPAKPARALLFSNYANQWTHLNTVREACKRAGLELDVMGSGVNAITEHPEALLSKYDVVFAKGRSAVEALAVGTAVVLCDAFGCGPMVTTTNLEQLRRQNLGIRTLSEEVDVDNLMREIARYDAADATEVSRMVRNSSDVALLADDVVGLYYEVIEQFRSYTRQPTEENRAVADYLRWLTLTVRDKQSEYEAMLANSLTLRVRNGLGRVPFANRLLRPLAALARRGNNARKS
jgi:hypothetical protein